MKHLAFISFSILVSYPLACGAQPSFDCRKAGTDTEKAICRSSTLSKLDLKLSRTFNDARSRAPQAAEGKVVRDQKSWLDQRDNCGSSEACIGNAMRDRIGHLEREMSSQSVASGVLPGVYCNRGGDEYLVVSKDGSGMRIVVGTVAVTGDSCGTNVMSAAEQNGGLVARESGCAITVYTRGGSVVASAAPPAVCDDQFCGFRAHLGEFVFNSAARRPLTTSPEAVDVWKVCE